MRIFVMVVQNGSLSSAGRVIGMSPASISRYINALEDSIGSRLLNRSSRKLTLTEAGQIYFKYTERVLHDLDEARGLISEIQGSPRGTLRVHSRLLVGTQKIVPALPEFMRRYPDIKIDLMMSNSVIDLIEQNIDIDIRIGELPDSTLIARKLLGSERVLCASPAYLQTAPPLTVPSELARHRCLTYRLNLGSAEWSFTGSGGVVTLVEVNGSFQTDFGPTLRELALAGAGIALMPLWSVSEDIKSGNLLPLLKDYRVNIGQFDYAVYAVYQQTRYMSSKVRIFIDFLSEVFREQKVGS